MPRSCSIGEGRILGPSIPLNEPIPRELSIDLQERSLCSTRIGERIPVEQEGASFLESISKTPGKHFSKNALLSHLHKDYCNIPKNDKKWKMPSASYLFLLLVWFNLKGFCFFFFLLFVFLRQDILYPWLASNSQHSQGWTSNFWSLRPYLPDACSTVIHHQA